MHSPWSGGNRFPLLVFRVVPCMFKHPQLTQYFVRGMAASCLQSGVNVEICARSHCVLTLVVIKLTQNKETNARTLCEPLCLAALTGIQCSPLWRLEKISNSHVLILARQRHHLWLLIANWGRLAGSWCGLQPDRPGSSLAGVTVVQIHREITIHDFNKNYLFLNRFYFFVRLVGVCFGGVLLLFWWWFFCFYWEKVR